MELSPVSSVDSSSDTASKTARLTVAEPVLASGSNSIKSKRSISSFADETALPPPLLLDASRLHACATKDLLVFSPIASALPPLQKPPLGTSIEPIASDAASHVPTAAKSPEKDSPSNKNKLSSSVFPWKTKWKPSVEDKNNWNRFLSTNSEEMSKSMQFSFNDLKLRGFAGHTSAVKSFAVNEAVKLFASGSKDKTVKLWSLNVHEGIENWEMEPYSEALLTYTGHRRGPIHDLHFLSTDLIASCDGQVHLWHPETGKPIHQFITGRAPIVSVKPFQHHVNMIGATADGYLIFLDEHNQQVMQTWKVNAGVTNGSIRNIAINPSGTRVAIGHSNGMISLLETRTGMLVDCWKGGDAEISQLKFYANDVLVTCAPADHMICCWNVNRLKLTKTISASLDVLSMNLFKDEILAINGNNSVSFIPINEELQSYSSKFKSSIFKSQVTAFTPVPADQLLLFGCAEGEIFLYA
ncbi:WD40-repeat-containing domain protein [Gongronella butleri]|nr:WD40-repeat-containing domain protein [Gongronella butleri]